MSFLGAYLHGVSPSTPSVSQKRKGTKEGKIMRSIVAAVGLVVLFSGCPSICAICPVCPVCPVCPETPDSATLTIHNDFTGEINIMSIRIDTPFAAGYGPNLISAPIAPGGSFTLDIETSETIRSQIEIKISSEQQYSTASWSGDTSILYLLNNSFISVYNWYIASPWNEGHYLYTP